MNLDVLIKGLRNPGAAIDYLLSQSKYTMSSAYWESYRKLRGIRSTKTLVDDFVDSNSEFCIVVLDSCRFDYFQKCFQDYFQGEVQPAWSPAPYTKLYFRRVFDREYDVTYISETPQAADDPHENVKFTPSKAFEQVIPVWEYEWDHLLAGTTAEAVTEAALYQATKSPRTRLITHYLAPHSPYRGDLKLHEHIVDKPETTADLDEMSKEEWLQGNEGGMITEEAAETFDISRHELIENDINTLTRSVHAQVKSGDIPRELFESAYEDNVRYVLAEVGRLISYLDCPVVITADHGEFLGEDGRYFHPQSSHPISRKVPWCVVDPEEIGVCDVDEFEFEFDVQEWEPMKDESAERLEHQLKDLGYM